MPGQLIGGYFISVTKDLIAGSILFPKIGARVSAMEADEWYEWAASSPCSA